MVLISVDAYEASVLIRLCRMAINGEVAVSALDEKVCENMCKRLNVEDCY